MAAHLRDIPSPKCARCGGKASKELRNTWNEIVNWYCGRHATAALREFRREVGEEK